MPSTKPASRSRFGKQTPRRKIWIGCARRSPNMSPVPTVERAPETARHPDHETSYLNGDDLRRDHHRSSIPDTLLGLTKFSAVIGFSDMAMFARVITAETPAMLAQRPRACADRAIRSERSPGVGAAARSQPAVVALRLPSPTSPGSSTNTGAEHGVASPPRPPSSPRWYAPPDAAFP